MTQHNIIEDFGEQVRYSRVSITITNDALKNQIDNIDLPTT